MNQWIQETNQCTSQIPLKKFKLYKLKEKRLREQEWLIVFKNHFLLRVMWIYLLSKAK